MSKVTEDKALRGMWLDSYVTLTETDEGTILYGPFDFVEEARHWANNLVSARVLPVYVPSHNRG